MRACVCVCVSDSLKCCRFIRLPATDEVIWWVVSAIACVRVKRLLAVCGFYNVIIQVLGSQLRRRFVGNGFLSVFMHMFSGRWLILMTTLDEVAYKFQRKWPASHWKCTSLVELSCWMKVHIVGSPQIISNGQSTCYQAILNSQWVPRWTRIQESLFCSCCRNFKRIARVHMNDADEFERYWLQYAHTIFAHRFFIVLYQQEPHWIITAKEGLDRIQRFTSFRSSPVWLLCCIDGVCVCVEHCVGCVQSWLLSKLTDFDRFTLRKAKKTPFALL